MKTSLRKKYKKKNKQNFIFLALGCAVAFGISFAVAFALILSAMGVFTISSPTVSDQRYDTKNTDGLVNNNYQNSYQNNKGISDTDQTNDSYPQKDEYGIVTFSEQNLEAPVVWKSQLIDMSIDFTNYRSTNLQSALYNDGSVCFEGTNSESLKVFYHNGLTITMNLNPCGLGGISGIPVRSKLVVTQTGESIRVVTQRYDDTIFENIEIPNYSIAASYRDDARGVFIFMTAETTDNTNESLVQEAERFMDSFIEQMSIHE